MSRVSLFDNPFLLGFDDLERLMTSTAKASPDSYPPYNIQQIGKDGLKITLAVAGFSENDLSIVIEDRQLIIRGKQQEDDTRVYLHRGIAARQFQSSYILASGIEVVGAALDSGLLHIDLMRPKLEMRQRVIKIDSKSQKSLNTTKKTIDVAAE